MSSQDKPIAGRGEATPATTSELDSFLAALKQRSASVSHGRLVFALDATASRQRAWDTACKLQADMFREAGLIGGLELQLVYYRGPTECRASRWISDTAHLSRIMS